MSNRTHRLLTLSLVFNVFLVGAIAGAGIMSLSAVGSGSLPSLGRSAGLLQTSQVLSPQYRPLMRQAVQQAAGTLRPHFEAVRHARTQAADALARPSLDKVMLENALAKGRAADLAIRTGFEEALVEMAVDLPLADRQALAQELRRSTTTRTPRPRTASQQAAAE